MSLEHWIVVVGLVLMVLYCALDDIKRSAKMRQQYNEFNAKLDALKREGKSRDNRIDELERSTYKDVSRLDSEVLQFGTKLSVLEYRNGKKKPMEVNENDKI